MKKPRKPSGWVDTEADDGLWDCRVRYVAPERTAPAVGVSSDSVDGVDITVPVYHFSETHYLADSAVTDAYRGQLFSLTGRTNNAAFKGLAAGECLFLWAFGAKRGSDEPSTPGGYVGPG